METSYVSPGKNEVAEDILKQMIDNHGVSEVYSMLAPMLGYNRVPPTIEEFLDDQDYLGDFVGPNIYPIWRAALTKIFPNPFHSPYYEIISTGAIGIGKSTLMKVGSLFDVFRLAIMNNPQERFGLMPTQSIVCSIINSTMGLGQAVLFDEMLEWMEGSNRFKELITSNTSSGFLPNKIDITVGSKVSHNLGKAVFSAILDEMNFRGGGATSDPYELYSNIKIRMKSRFMKRAGKMPPVSHLWMGSSARNSDDFLDKHMETNRDDDSTIIFNYPIWEAKKDIIDRDTGTKLYTGKTFKIYAGDESKEPFIMTDEHKGDHYKLDDSRVIDVPVELRSEFELDLPRSIQDLAGISVASLFKFLPAVTKLNQCMMMKNWFDKEILQIDFWNNDDSIVRYIDKSKITSRVNPTKLRYIHIDIGYASDRTGIACTHIAGFVNKSSLDVVTGKTDMNEQPWFITDFVIAIEKKPGQEVPIFKLKNFIMDLRALGLPIGGVSTDGHQSVQLRQELQLAGFVASYISCDRTPEAYWTLKNSIYEDRINLPIHDLLKREIRGLQSTEGGKIDHPKEGSKDVADGLAGSVQNAYLNRNKFSAYNAFEKVGLAELDSFLMNSEFDF